MHTSVVDEDVDVPWTGLDLLESLLDRVVTGEIKMERFNSVGRPWTFLVEGLDGEPELIQRTTTEQNVVGLVRLEQGLHSLVAYPAVAAGDEDYLWGRHCCHPLLLR